MSILDKFSSMFGSKDAEPIAPASAETTEVELVSPMGESATPAEADISPQPDMITPEGETPAEEAPEEKNEGEGQINLNI